jgi:cell division protein YceG involved in septum cleavage
MYTGQVAVISNKATWASDVVELVDEDDGTTTDLTDVALTVDIVVTIKDISGCTTLATASIANGKVTIPGPGFQWQFEVDDLSRLCAGTYRLGAKVTIDDFVNDLIDGTIAVVEGN